MAQIFVSYASQDRSRIRPLISALESEGFSVWWDRDIHPGPAFDREIEQAIDAAGCVLAVWTRASVQSEWVRSEVEEGARRGILVPARLEDVLPPLAHRRRQTADLSAWTGAHDEAFEELVAGIQAVLNSSRSTVQTPDDAVPAARAKSRSRVSLIAAALGAALALGFVLPFPGTGPETEERTTLTVEDPSIAVLPFRDLSAAGDQGYFADGIAEELLQEFTRLDGLRVASRTSSFAVRGADNDIRSIGQMLKVSTVLEGSVRRSDDRLRITAQLTDTRSGYQLWTRVFERESTDIFEIQDEIAEAVAGALGVTLGVGDVNAFRGAGTQSLEAYDTYLRALQVTDFTERVRLLEHAIELDPNYGAALARLGLAIAGTMWAHPPQDAPDILESAVPLLLRAVELAPDSAYAFQLLATVNYARLRWSESEEYFARARAIKADTPLLRNYSNFHARTGRLRAAEVLGEAGGPDGDSLWVLGTFRRIARRELDAVDALLADQPLPTKIRIEWELAFNLGDPERLRAVLEQTVQRNGPASRLLPEILEDFDEPAAVLETVRRVHADPDMSWPAKHRDIALFAAFFGDPELALESMAIEARLTTIRYFTLWYPVMAEVRALPGFEDLMREVGLTDYWRAHGWADYCRPLGPEDFECF